MCAWRSRLTLSTIAARVVDLPEPVGPVTRIKPRGFSQSLVTTPGRPSSSNDLISYGIDRKTAPTAPRWLNMLARNLESPFIPKEKSNSSVSSNRCFCASVNTEYASCLVSAGVSSEYSSALSTPCTRTIGAEFVVICRSDPPCSVIFLSNSLNAISAINSSEVLFHRFPRDFFQSSHALPYLFQTTPSERKHPVFYCFPAKLKPRSSDQNQLAKLFSYLHDLIQPNPALVTSAITVGAPRSFKRLYLFHLARGKANVNHRLIQIPYFHLAFLADATHKSLSLYEIHRRRHQEGFNTHVH